uniref:Uncharacterized protein n=2 Tax=Lygus hesperus TaxID=30085 RepID=A0A0A9XRE9_LYGHE
MKKYVGYRQEAILALYSLKDRTRPICYGIIIDDLKALVPCECVSAGRNKGDVATPWSHPKPPKPVFPVDEKLYEVGLMSYQYNHKDTLSKRESIKKIILDKRCDGSYFFNYAALILTSRIENSRLVWVNSDSEALMSWQTINALHGSVTSGKCMLLRWINNQRTVFKLVEGKMQQVIETVKPNEYIVATEKIDFNNWFKCIPNVCPRLKPMYTELKPSPRVIDKYCFNNNSGSRHCAHWYAPLERLCSLLPGTPIFCDMQHTFQGVIGLHVKAATSCRESSHAVLAGIEDALDLIQNDLRISNAPGYKETLQWWTKYHSEINAEGLSISSSIVVNSILTFSAALSILKL